ncbi:MAG: YihA family ribosome biogenesis GTP-binding protein [Ruminococcus sp.]|nr:YihA family ribosome biogenesis GTP-binding protein [Ruminococcus sp.]
MNWNNAEFFTSFGSLSQLPEADRPEIAFSGRSNVGKSSLINKLINRKALARVSSMPGKTVTINFYKLDDIYLADLPGYGYAKTAKGLKRSWSDLIGGYLASDREIDLVLQLIDIRHAPSADDIQMINFLIDSELPFIIVFTKADKLGANARKERMKAFAEEIPQFEDIVTVEFSSVTGESRDRLRELIESAVEPEE